MDNVRWEVNWKQGEYFTREALESLTSPVSPAQYWSLTNNPVSELMLGPYGFHILVPHLTGASRGQQKARAVVSWAGWPSSSGRKKMGTHWAGQKVHSFFP